MVDLTDWLDGYVFDGSTPLGGGAGVKLVTAAVDAHRLTDLSGSFAGTYRQTDGTTVMVTDRVGSRPLYYAVDGESPLVSCDFWGLARRLATRTLSAESAVEMLTYGYALESRTILEEIHEAPPASVTIIANGQVASTCYWRFGGQIVESLDANEAARQLRGIFDGIGRRSAAVVEHLGIGRLGLNLTGGRDSRALASALTRAGIRPAVFTSREESKEYLLAAEVANHLNVSHTVVPMWVSDPGRVPIPVVDALCPTTTFSVAGQPMSLLMSGPWPVDGFVSGHLADVPSGSIYSAGMLAALASSPEAAAAFDGRKQVRVRADPLRSVLLPLHHPLVDEIAARYRWLILDAWREGPAGAMTRVNIEQRQRRYILRDQVALGLLGPSFPPFLDTDWLDFWGSVPVEWLARERLQARALLRTVFVDEHAPLAAIRLTGHPLTESRFGEVHRAQQWARKKAKNARVKLGLRRERDTGGGSWPLSADERSALNWLVDPRHVQGPIQPPILAHTLRSIARASVLAS